MFRLRKTLRQSPAGLLNSSLFDDATFYLKFVSDLNLCHNEAIIESPFITTRRIDWLSPTIRTLIRRGVAVTINTKNPLEHNDNNLAWKAQAAIQTLQALGVQVLFTGGHHRKLAVLDRAVLWEGSLNILSQNHSCEIMRRIESPELAEQMIAFTGLNNFLQ